ncbi:MAG: ABC-2 family transporter protein [Deltaproteobacteria bacterium]|nr:ABC-2 family transporter protein [Deltaproteobacteria bacterium]
MRVFLRAFPALLRVGFAEAMAYRAEFLVWTLCTTMPLVMLAIWTAVARDAPVGMFTPSRFAAYYLGALIVRTVTGSWVVWEMNHEIRTGTLSLRLLRPIHPFLAYSAQHLAAIPLRGILALPVATIMLLSTGSGHVLTDPVQAIVLVVALLGAWLITFLAMTVIGTLGLFIDRSIAVFEVWLGAFMVLSGYLIPLDLLPPWVSTLAKWLPFRYMLGHPVEIMIGMTDRAQALAGCLVQWAWVGLFLLLSRATWHAGVRRFEAYGG